MKSKDEIISELLFRQITNNLTQEEQLQLDQWRHENEANKKLSDKLNDLSYVEKKLKQREMINTERPMNDMKNRLKLSRRKTIIKQWRPWTIAASIAIIIGISLNWLYNQSSQEHSHPSITARIEKETIHPGETKATLILADGEKLELDKKGFTDRIIQKQKSALAHKTTKELSLEVPRGGEFKIILEDSTEVWLNSESKLIYPESFAENERRVVLVGEAYFKVKKDSSRPFYVDTDKQRVRVYGTEFNIQAYSDDEWANTTLVTGSISLSLLNGKSGELLLTPGHQSSFNRQSETTSIKAVDANVVTSWKDGRFVFENQNLEQIMKVLSRWYNFEYEFKDIKLKNIEFIGSIPRYSEIETALTLLEKSGGLKFTIQGTKVTIYSHNK